MQSGKTQLSVQQSIEQVGGLRPLLSGVRGPASLLDGVVYAGFSVLAKILSRRQATIWHRDDTNRASTAAEPSESEPSR